MIAVKEDSQVCVDEHFEHQVTAGDPAWESHREKPLRHLAGRNQDHHDQSLVSNTLEEEKNILTEYRFHLLDTLNPC